MGYSLDWIWNCIHSLQSALKIEHERDILYLNHNFLMQTASKIYQYIYLDLGPDGGMRSLQGALKIELDRNILNMSIHHSFRKIHL